MAENYYRKPGRWEAMCRHCPGLIVQLESGVWVDTFGFNSCMKGVPHAPLPEHEPPPKPDHVNTEGTNP